MNIAGIHAFSHEDADHAEECELCEFVITTNQITIVAFDYESTPYSHEILLEESNYSYSPSFSESHLNGISFGRPPPGL